MNLHSHLIVSAALGTGISAITGDPVLIGVTVAAGVLPDADHAIDFYNWYVRRSPSRLFLILHGWEYLAAAIFLYGFVITEPWMLALVVGYSSQLIGDQLFNRPKWLTYFVIVRAANGFRWEGITDDRPADRGYQSLMSSIVIFRKPLFGWFESRCESLPDPTSNPVDDSSIE